MEVQNNLLVRLKCFYCSSVLSCSPVLVTATGKNVCGRCREPKKSEEIFIRNTMYEELAMGCLFPCQYKLKGCSQLLTMSEVLTHEENCKYNTHRCPTASLENKCNWSGTMAEIEEHYKTTHPDLIVNHPYTEMPNIKRNYLQYKAFNAFGYFFILQEKCNVSSGKYWFSVIFVGSSQLAKLFEFSCKLDKSKDSLIKTRPVQYNPLFIMHEEGCVTQKINNLFQELGDYDETKLHLSVTMKKVNCFQCKTPLESAPIFITNGEHFCQNCYPKPNESKVLDCQDFRSYNNNYELDNSAEVLDCQDSSSYTNSYVLDNSAEEVKEKQLVSVQSTATQTLDVQILDPDMNTENRIMCRSCSKIEEEDDDFVPVRIYFQDSDTQTDLTSEDFERKDSIQLTEYTKKAAINESSIKKEKCYLCRILSKTPIHPTEDGLICDECYLGTLSAPKTPGLPCKNSSCLFKHSDVNILTKHSTWLCKNEKSECEICFNEYTGNRYIDHLIQQHSNRLSARVVQNQATVECSILPGRYRYSFRAYGMLFFFRIAYSSKNIDFYLIFDEDRNADDLFTGNYNINTPDGGMKGKLSVCKKGRDWSNYIDIRGLDLDDGQKIYFVLNVVRK